MKLTIEITMNNAAFEGSPFREVERLLKNAVEKMYMKKRYGNLYDVNGNKCGSFALSNR